MGKIIPFITPKLSLSKNVAIIGSGSILLEKTQGTWIDSFDEVIRFNEAPIKGFEKFVGEKTTLHVLNHSVFTRRIDDFLSNESIPKILCTTTKPHLASRYSIYTIDYNKAPDFKKRTSTTGLAVTAMIINAGIKPHLFGFWGVPGEDGKNKLSHYWQNTEIKTNHDYINERQLLKEWHEQDKIIWHI